MDEEGVTNPQSVTVFDIARADEDVDVVFPFAWARRHERVEVLLERHGMFGWKAQVVGDDDEHLLGFPWTDHVNRILLGGNERGQLPVDLSAGVWDDLKQGWWAPSSLLMTACSSPRATSTRLSPTSATRRISFAADQAWSPSTVSRCNGMLCHGVSTTKRGRVRWLSSERLVEAESERSSSQPWLDAERD